MRLTRRLATIIGTCVTLVAVTASSAGAESKATVDGDWVDPSATRAASLPYQKAHQLDGVRPFSGHGPGWYYLYDAVGGVKVRQGAMPCYDEPGQGTCISAVDAVHQGEAVWVRCQRAGQTIGGNPYWVYIHTPNGISGYFASRHIDNYTNWIDGVPYCS